MRVIKFEDKTEILKIAIYTEDTYGPAFIRKVINRLIKDGKIKNRKFEYQRNSPALIKKCNESKFRKVRSVIKEVDRVLIIIDKEKTYNYDENKAVWQHLSGLKNEYLRKIVVIATEPEIEEWICISLGIDFDRTGYNAKDKPSEVLKRKLGYKKERLKDFANKLDFNKLLAESESFKLFYESLTT
jgi:hypothetical protein